MSGFAPNFLEGFKASMCATSEDALVGLDNVVKDRIKERRRIGECFLSYNEPGDRDEICERNKESDGVRVSFSQSRGEDGGADSPYRDIIEEDMKITMNQARWRIENEEREELPDREPWRKIKDGGLGRTKDIFIPRCRTKKTSLSPSSSESSFVHRGDKKREDPKDGLECSRLREEVDRKTSTVMLRSDVKMGQCEEKSKHHSEESHQDDRNNQPFREDGNNPTNHSIERTLMSRNRNIERKTAPTVGLKAKAEATSGDVNAEDERVARILAKFGVGKGSQEKDKEALAKALGDKNATSKICKRCFCPERYCFCAKLTGFYTTLKLDEWHHDEEGRPTTNDVEVQCDRTDAILSELKSLQAKKAYCKSHGISTVIRLDIDEDWFFDLDVFWLAQESGLFEAFVQSTFPNIPQAVNCKQLVQEVDAKTFQSMLSLLSEPGLEYEEPLLLTTEVAQMARIFECDAILAMEERKQAILKAHGLNDLSTSKTASVEFRADENLNKSSHDQDKDETQSTGFSKWKTRERRFFPDLHVVPIGGKQRGGYFDTMAKPNERLRYGDSCWKSWSPYTELRESDLDSEDMDERPENLYSLQRAVRRKGRFEKVNLKNGKQRDSSKKEIWLGQMEDDVEIDKMEMEKQKETGKEMTKLKKDEGENKVEINSVDCTTKSSSDSSSADSTLATLMNGILEELKRLRELEEARIEREKIEKEREKEKERSRREKAMERQKLRKEKEIERKKEKEKRAVERERLKEERRVRRVLLTSSNDKLGSDESEEEDEGGSNSTKVEDEGKADDDGRSEETENETAAVKESCDGTEDEDCIDEEGTQEGSLDNDQSVETTDDELINVKKKNNDRREVGRNHRGCKAERPLSPTTRRRNEKTRSRTPSRDRRRKSRNIKFS